MLFTSILNINILQKREYENKNHSLFYPIYLPDKHQFARGLMTDNKKERVIRLEDFRIPYHRSKHTCHSRSGSSL